MIIFTKLKIPLQLIEIIMYSNIITYFVENIDREEDLLLYSMSLQLFKDKTVIY